MSKLKSAQELEALWSGLDKPLAGQKYRHYKGDEYEIVACGLLEATEAPCIVYKSLSKNIVWVRPAKNFLEDIEYKGLRQPRFKLI